MSSDLTERNPDLSALARTTREQSLHRLAVLATAQVSGCSAVSVALWQDTELAGRAASHPDAARLDDLQLRSRTGPLPEALASGATVHCADTLTETRWPGYAAAALQCGLRCSTTLAYRGQVTITLSLCAARPRAIDPGRLELAELLAAYGGALVGAAGDYGDSQRTAAQLRDAAAARAVVDQAKGLLMHALNCTAEEALQRIRDVSQRSNTRTTDVAQRLIDAHSSRASRPGGGPAAGLGPDLARS